MTITETEAETALAYLREHAEEHLKGLDELLRMESVSADPTKKDEMRRTAQWIADHFTEIGFENARLTDTRSHPVVTADWLHAGPDKPTAWCTAITTSSQPIRSRSGSDPRSSRGTRTTSCTPAAPATTRASCTCTSAPPRRG